MAAAGALRDAITAALEALPAGARPTYARSNRAYKRTARQPDVGVSSHRMFWFGPPDVAEDGGQGPNRLMVEGAFPLYVALNLAGLSNNQRFDAIEQEGLLVLATVKTTAHPAGVRAHRVKGWEHTPEGGESDPLEDVTLALEIQYTGLEAI